IFHTKKRQSFTLADIINRENVGMIETRCRFGFTTETLESFARIRVIAQDALQRDDAARMALLCAIHHAHPAARNLLQDFIISEPPFSVRNVDLTEELLETRVILAVRFVRSERPRE